MLSALYNALWYPALPIALIVSAGAERQAWRERLGRGAITASPSTGPRAWIHAASVGEIEAVRPVATRLAHEFPAIEMVVTTMTAAGREAARRRIPHLVVAQLAPLDWPLAVRSFIRRTRPDLLLIAETELWPNYFIEAARAGVKVAIINGRISTRSVRRYGMIGGLISAALAHADLVLAQTADDADRYRQLGAAPPTVIITGNTKFDPGDAAPPLRQELAAFAAGQPILIAGSTAPREERIVLAAYQQLLGRFAGLGLILAPRHLDRAAEIAAMLKGAHVPFVQASQLSGERLHSNTGSRQSVLLLDTMGELRSLYRRATIAFVGGSLEPGRGGQNPAEPAACAIPVMFGPYHENQREPAEALLASGGARIVRDAAEIASAAAVWLSDPEAGRIAGENASAAIDRLGGGTIATLNHLRPLLPKA
jgi:3-deoxy-D-manno-octulosonic-acid transferase